MGQQGHRSIEAIPACELVADAVRQGVKASDLLAARLASLGSLGDLGLCSIDEIARGNP